MRHIFIINPTAGKRDCTIELMEMAKGLEARHHLTVDCILTKNKGYATEVTRNIAASGEDVRFYACGGDGTANEVANGIVGRENAAMTCIPIGTGNDFLKISGIWSLCSAMRKTSGTARNSPWTPLSATAAAP